MDLAHLRKYLTTEISPTQRYLWLGLSLLISLSYSLPVMLRALFTPDMIQDDARQHVTWMLRFMDPTLFPNDLMADYFQSVAPWGYKTLYYLVSQVGIDAITFSKILPSILALLTTVYAFGATLQFLPSPVAAFISATLLNQNLWLRDDIVSGSPVAFVYPFFTAFFYYLMRRSLLPCLATLVLLGLFYPQVMLLAGGILFLRLFTLYHWRLGLAPLADRRFYLMGLGVVVLLLVPYVLASSPYGPVISRAEALTMPAFAKNGWSEFFVNHFTNFWFCGKRSGFLPTEWCAVSFSLPQVGLGLILPLLILERDRFPLAKQVRGEALIVPQTLVVSLGLFFLAHAMLFHLHLPNRYGEHSLRIVMALSSGVTLVILWDRLLGWVQQWNASSQKTRASLALGLTTLLGVLLLANPYQLNFEDEDFPVARYVKGHYPEVYQYLARQPKDTRIASISDEVNNIPSFTQRPVFVGGGGYVLPYHNAYFQQAQQRVRGTINAQYNPQLGFLQQFIRNNGIDYWLIDRNFTEIDYFGKEVFAQFPNFRRRLKQSINQGTVPALARVRKPCVVAQGQFGHHGVELLDAACLLKPR